MSKYFDWVEGKLHPYYFKKVDRQMGEHNYHLYLGEHFICQLFRNGKEWGVIVQGDIIDNHSRLVQGFISRHSAIHYALKIHKLTRYDS